MKKKNQIKLGLDFALSNLGGTERTNPCTKTTSLNSFLHSPPKLRLKGWLIEQCFTAPSTSFQSHHGDRGCFSPVLVFKSVFPKDNPLERKKKPEGSVRLEPRTSKLRVKHYNRTTWDS